MEDMFLYTFSLEMFQKQGSQETSALLINLVHLVNDLRQHLEFHEIEVLCHLVECLTTTIMQQEKGMSSNESAFESSVDANFESVKLTELPKEMLSHFEKLCQHVKTFIGVKLFQLDKHVTVQKEELNVSFP